MRRPSELSVSREIHPALVPSRLMATATLDSAPATCTKRWDAASRGTPGGAESRSMVSPIVTTSGTDDASRRALSLTGRGPARTAGRPPGRPPDAQHADAFHFHLTHVAGAQ